jgi:hypothetical protein
MARRRSQLCVRYPELLLALSVFPCAHRHKTFYGQFALTRRIMCGWPFNHGLLSRSCGGLCGNGGVFVYDKTVDGWERERNNFAECHWVS